MANLFVLEILAVRRQSRERRESSTLGNGFLQGNQSGFGLQGDDGDDGDQSRSQLTFSPLDPDIASSKAKGSALTFEQFEDRLQETTSKRNSVAYSLSGGAVSDGYGVSTSRRPSLLANRLSSQEHQTKSTIGGPSLMEYRWIMSRFDFSADKPKQQWRRCWRGRRK